MLLEALKAKMKEQPWLKQELEGGGGGGGADRMGIRKQCVGLLTYRPGLDKEAQDQDLSSDSESLHRNLHRGPGSLQIWSHHAIGILCGVITPLVHIVGRESRGSVPAVKFLAFTMPLVCFLKEHIFVRHVGGIGQRPRATW